MKRDGLMRHRSVVETVLALGLLVTACADSPEGSALGSRAAEPFPDVVELVCEADGGTTLLTPEATVQPDGVHLHVENRLDEPASINGLAWDASPGSSDVVVTAAPGRVDVACWPFSQHREDEPRTVALRIVDENGIYVSPEVECDGLSWQEIRDFVDMTSGARTDPLVLAEENLRGLRASDQLEVAGYPEAPVGVRVVREGRTIALVSMQDAADGGLLIVGGSGCHDDGVNLRP